MKRSETCGKCGNQKYDNGKKLVCRDCNNKRVSEWQKNNREAVNEKYRNWNLKNKERLLLLKRLSKVKKLYGLTKEQYFTLIEKYNNKCAICGEQEETTLKGTLWNLSIDHCHTTNKVRGLLCHDCNVILGKLKDSVDMCKSIIKYLEKSF